MAKFVVYDSDHSPRLTRGDIIHCGDDDMNFGKEELANPMFCCIEVPDMTYGEGLNKARSFEHSVAQQRDIPKEFNNFIDLDTLLGPDRNRSGKHIVNRTNINAHTKSRNERNPHFEG